MPAPVHWTMVEAGPAMEKWLAGEGLEFLSPTEREILAGLRFERRRVEWLLGRWGAKRLITAVEFAGGEDLFSSISILNEAGGAPIAVCADGQPIPGCISISHRAGVAACAWTGAPALRMGMDIDLVEARDPSFLSGYFTENEQAFTRALPANLRDTWITLAWSAKESLLKALKTGLRIDTRRIQVGSPRGLFLDETNETEWKTLSVRLEDGMDTQWHAWWRKRGPFVLTLVCEGGGAPRMPEEM